MTSDASAERAPGTSRRESVAEWYGVLAPPLAVLVHMNVIYPLVERACITGSRLALWIVPLVFLAIAISGGLVSLGVWRRAGSEWPGDHREALGRERLLAVVGMLGAALFSAIILWQWIATFILSPCQ
ncbi:MAG TPA: hypothetical protein VFS05_04290 [Gemmatimonadaceae bacterium]|nr:hypothetical protein [Gemmatimonadaceae bacterium]